jgi:hypothetical protein
VKKKESAGVVSQLRSAIIGSGRSLNDIGRETGVGPDRLSRFLRGERDLTLAAVEKLCRLFRLELVPEGPAGASKPATAKGHKPDGGKR